MSKRSGLELLSELEEMFYVCKPDEEYLEDDDDTAVEVEEIESMLRNDDTPILDKIREIANFNRELFPDEIDEDEQDQYDALLTEAFEFLEANK